MEKSQMSATVKIDGVEYDRASLSENTVKFLNALRFTEARISERLKLYAQLALSRGACVDALKREIVSARSGIDFSTFLAD